MSRAASHFVPTKKLSIVNYQFKIKNPLYFFRNMSYNKNIGQIKADKTPTKHFGTFYTVK